MFVCLFVCLFVCWKTLCLQAIPVPLIRHSRLPAFRCHLSSGNVSSHPSVTSFLSGSRHPYAYVFTHTAARTSCTNHSTYHRRCDVIAIYIHRETSIHDTTVTRRRICLVSAVRNNYISPIRRPQLRYSAAHTHTETPAVHVDLGTTPHLRLFTTHNCLSGQMFVVSPSTKVSYSQERTCHCVSSFENKMSAPE